MNQPYHNDADWLENKALTETMIRRCEECHPYDKHPFPRYLSDKFHWATFYNFSIPEKSRMLRPFRKMKAGWDYALERIRRLLGPNLSK